MFQCCACVNTLLLRLYCTRLLILQYMLVQPNHITDQLQTAFETAKSMSQWKLFCCS